MSALLDTRFDRFITPRLLSVVYVLGLVITALTWLLFVISAFAGLDFGQALFAAVIITLAAVVQLLLVRVAVEAIALFFRIGADVRQLRDRATI